MADVHRSRLSTRRRRVVLVAAASLVLLGALALAVRTGVGPFGYPAHPIPLRQASVDDSGRLLTVVGEHGCDEFSSVAVEEGAAEVRVTVRMRHRDSACPSSLSRGAVTVRLQHALGDRTVRDGGYGQDVTLVRRDLRQGPRLLGAPQPYARP